MQCPPKKCRGSLSSQDAPIPIPPLVHILHCSKEGRNVFGASEARSQTMSFRILVVDDDANRTRTLGEALAKSGHVMVARIDPVDDWLVQILANAPDAVIVTLDTPATEAFESLRRIARAAPRPIVMFVGQSDESQILRAIEAGASAYIVDGWDVGRVHSILDVAVARFKAQQALRAELEQTKTSLIDRKTVDRAKGILMQRRNLSEDQAYKLLRKLAMDQNKRIGEVARSVIAMSDIVG